MKQGTLQVITRYLGKRAGKVPYAVLVGNKLIARFATETHARQYAVALDTMTLPAKF